MTTEPIPSNPTEPESTAPPKHRLIDLLGRWEAEAIAAHEAKQAGRPRGPITGFAALDREMGGHLRPGLHVGHGTPGAGKTAFALQVAATCGFPAIYVTVEMDPLVLFPRIVARTTGTFLSKLESGVLSPAESLILAKRAAFATPLLEIVDATQIPCPPAWIQGYALQARERNEASSVLVVVDSAHSWSRSVWRNTPTEYDRLGEALEALSTIALHLHCPILVIAERNRGSMQSGGMHASAGNRAFEYGAKSVIELGRKEGDAPDIDGEVEVTVGLSKNRANSPGGVTKLCFKGATMCFREREAPRF